MLSSVLLFLGLASILQCCEYPTQSNNAPELMHQVSVKYYNQHLCTGSLITSFHVLTVASCFIVTRSFWSKFEGIEVIIYDTSISRIIFVSLIKNIIMHENHVSNDIALIILSSPYYTSHILSFEYAKIPLRDENVKPGFAIASGFIRVSPESENDERITYRKIIVKVLNPQNCSEKLALETPDSYICVDDSCRVINDCRRNLGGSLIVNGQVVGLLSRERKEHCLFTPDDKPVGFTRVSKYSDWIVKETFKSREAS